MNRRTLAAAAALVVGCFAIYAQTRDFQFVSLDDNLFVYANEHVRPGLTWAGIRWALTANYMNWQPLAWLSHMAAISLFGLSAGPHHLINACLHAANAVLLFLLLQRLTGAFWPSLAAASFWALHPLRVESVAWITERKDVLSGLFALLTIWFYLDYVEKPGRRYWRVVAVFALGLMSKPMLMTLPAALLLLDYWPLGRWPATHWKKLVLEKLPLAAMSAASLAITFFGQRASGAVGNAEVYPLALRIQNAAVAYVLYLRDLVWPASLAVLYPYPPAIPLVELIGALAALAGITWLAIRRARVWPWLVVGWLWYLMTLVPVIGLVQVGAQPRADRYTYLPAIFLTVALVWFVRDWAKPALVLCIPLTLASMQQTSYWSDSVALYTHAIEAHGGTHQVRTNLGGELLARNRPADALPHLAAALREVPDDTLAQFNLGMALLATGKAADALPFLQNAVRNYPQVSRVHYQLARALVQVARADEAVAEFRKALALGVPADFLPQFQKELDDAEALRQR